MQGNQTLPSAGNADPAVVKFDAKEIATYYADWLVDAVAGATQDRRLLRGDPTEDRVLTDAILLNGRKAILNAIAKATSAP